METHNLERIEEGANTYNTKYNNTKGPCLQKPEMRASPKQQALTPGCSKR